MPLATKFSFITVGSGKEIRDEGAVGRGSKPKAGMNFVYRSS